MKITIDILKEEFKQRGSILLSTYYLNNRTPLLFTCTNCGGVHRITYSDFKSGSNKNLLCFKCMKNRKPSISLLREEFRSKGSKLLTDYYINNRQPLYFNCSVCGDVHHITYGKYREGVNNNLLCPHCMPGSKLEVEQIKSRIFNKGAEFLRIEGNRIYFKCSNCRNVHFISRRGMKLNKNKNFLCTDCLKGNSFNPQGALGKRKLVDGLWYSLVKEFFNIHSKEYASHHILPWGKYEDYRTSVINGYPLNKKLHSLGYINSLGEKNPYHLDRSYLNPENWEDLAKLPYHTYKDFKFLNLNEKVVMQILPTDIEWEQAYLLNRKKEFYIEGKFYIPVYFEETFIKNKRRALFSLIKKELFKHYQNIYEYTGTKFTSISEDKLKVVELLEKEAKLFLTLNNIYGFLQGEVYLGLKDTEDNLIQVLVFSKSKLDLDYDFELISFTTKEDTFVENGYKKIFKYFIEKFKPNSIVAYGDIRFISLDYTDNDYYNLGFKYIATVDPKFKYSSLKYNRLYSRNQVQQNKLKLFDTNLSEHQNMINNGYIRQYDCGSYKFSWRFLCES